MRVFEGRLVSHRTGEDVAASFHVDGKWVRVVAGHRRLGAWQAASLHCERVTVFRFRIHLDEETYTFAPDDPSEFASTVGAVIDLRPKSRFGLGDRVRAARAEIEAARAAAASE